jgi:hypothetical protein
MRHPQHGDFQSQLGMYCTHVLKLGRGRRVVDPEPRRIDNGREPFRKSEIHTMHVSKILMGPNWHCSPLLILSFTCVLASRRSRMCLHYTVA